MISERLLKNWRRDALHMKSLPPIIILDSTESIITIRLTKEYAESLNNNTKAMNDRILRLTQHLLDQHLIQKRG